MKNLRSTMIYVLIIAICGVNVLAHAQNNRHSTDPLRIGWIGAMSGPGVKYGADKAAQLALRDINASGGILGRPLELIMEDAQCQSLKAATAAQKLINVDKVDFIIGGHCSPESMAIAPIAEAAKVVMLAAISSNTALSDAGDYVFRVSSSGTKPAEKLANFMTKQRKLKTLAIIYEDTSYSGPPSEYLKKRLLELGGEKVFVETFNPGETDFRASIARIRSNKPEAVYIAAQAQDTAALIMSQLKQQGLSAQIFGNELTGNAVTIYKEDKALFEGMVFAEAAFNTDSPRTTGFIKAFNEYFHVNGLPYGLWTAESYDSVMLLAETIKRCGLDKEAVKKCLYQVKDYEGVSGTISIDEKGDGIRNYVLKEVRDASIEEYVERF